MAVYTDGAGQRHGGVKPLPSALAWWALAMMLCLNGCSGCNKTPEDREKEKQAAAEKKKKEKDPFEGHAVAFMPAGKDRAGYCKPGHWVSQVWTDVASNRGDFQGELQTEVVDSAQRPVPLLAVPYQIATERPAVLAKEQAKSLESATWIPLSHGAKMVSLKLSAGGGAVVLQNSVGFTAMPSYRYFFVVLSNAAGRYEYLNKKASIQGPKRSGDPGAKYYEVVFMPGARRPGLPSNALYWTSIAYLLWDDFDPVLCDAEQQQALIDWLHWGGQIILSGPDSLERLRNSFLGPYLPATVEKSRTFSARDLTELQYWAGQHGLPPRPTKPWTGATLKLSQDATDLRSTGEHLVVERKVGRGRIVATAFRLSGIELTSWSGFDCFFNACLLRRPARRFWIDKNSDEQRFAWLDDKDSASPHDAARMTAVRYFVRDTGVGFQQYATDMTRVVDSRTVPQVPANYGSYSQPLPDDDDSSPYSGVPAPGLGAWNDYSPVAQKAREALRDASGISVPERSFIVWVVVGYLCVLVPVNWLIFRLLGRVEWAWIAAPLVAIGCTILVIHLAQLNIGFARSRNEIAVIEMQPGYSRAHVTRYTALYTSLATRYEFHLDDPAGQILPFPGDDKSDAYKGPASIFGSIGELVCRRGDDTRLSGFRVASNAVNYMHCEEMAEFDSAVTLHKDSDGNLRVTNGTKHPLDECQAVRGGESGVELAEEIPHLDPGATAILNFDRREKAVDDRRRRRGPAVPESRVLLPDGEPNPAEGSGTAPQDDLSGTDSVPQDLSAVNRTVPIGDKATRRWQPSGKLSAGGIAKIALHNLELRSDEICLVARVADEVPGLAITPERQQTRQAALLIAHLKAGELPDPVADTIEGNVDPSGGNRHSVDATPETEDPAEP